MAKEMNFQKEVVQAVAEQNITGGQHIYLSESSSQTGEPSAIFRVPIAKNPAFTGRVDELQRIHDALHSGQSVAISQTITGSGGVGKSALAAEYAYRYQKGYEVILWVLAETRQSLRNSFLGYAETFGVAVPQGTPEDSVIRQVLARLTQHKAWLLICDNADDPSVITGFCEAFQFGAEAGHFLLTTRNHNLHTALGANEIPLSVFKDTEEGADFLWARTQRNRVTATPAEQTACREIVVAVDRFPLALEQVGAFLVNNRGIRFAGYLAEYRKRSLRLFGEKTNLLNYKQTILTTWEPNFEAIATANPQAAELLHLCAYLAPDSIPIELLESAFPEAEDESSPAFRCADQLKAITNYSLLTENESDSEDRPTYSIHRLVQEVLRERGRTSPFWGRIHRFVQKVLRKRATGRAEEQRQQAVEALGRATPDSSPENYFAWVAGCRRLEEQWAEAVKSLADLVPSAEGGASAQPNRLLL